MMQPSATRLSEAERELDYIESLLPSQRSEIQQSWLDDYEAFLHYATLTRSPHRFSFHLEQENLKKNFLMSICTTLRPI